ncbi:MAG: ATP-binding cassette domain-containing protein, partial [Proteobacteria bacterium]|nr:ATP-binding cassette domain-containing protein [Pseudomonadota bacterium]
MKPILSISKLSVDFINSGDTQATNAVNDVSFELKPAQITAIVGQSGSGKSTLALAITNLLANNAQIKGEISFNHSNKTIDLTKLSQKQLCKIRGKEIGMIFQDPMTSLNPLHTIKKQIGEAITIHNKISANKLTQRINELLELVDLKNFSHRLNSYPHELSGGQKQRVMIAIAIANNPKILIADEPTTALDVSTENEILKLLLHLREKLGISILFITHNLKLVKKLADEVLVMHKSQIVERGSAQSIFTKPENDYTKRLIAALNFKLHESNKISDQTVLQAQNLQVKFAIKKNFFGIAKSHLYANDDISFELKAGENLGVIGESGSGKSTLAMAIGNLVKSTGKVIFNGQDFKKLSPKEQKHSRRAMQIIFQDP